MNILKYKEYSEMNKRTKTVYHGSPILFDEILIDSGKNARDFGQGFYLSDDRTHALSAGKKKARLLGLDKVYLYTYELPVDWTSNIKRHVFREANMSWLNYIIANRRMKQVEFYDVVYGPTADARTEDLIRLYLNGYYGKVGSSSAVASVIQNLKVSRFARQVCIKSNEAKQYIKRVKVEVLNICDD
jgi:hypothetical protein